LVKRRDAKRDEALFWNRFWKELFKRKGFSCRFRYPWEGRMVFGTFAAARDTFYGSALLMGLAVGFALRILKARRHRDVLVTGVMYLFSLALFVTALVLILSHGAVLYERGLVRVALFIVIGTAICAFFPVQAAFPAVIIAGVLVVWAAAVFWQYPKDPDPQKSVQVAVRSGDLLPIIGGEIRYFDREPANSLLFREEFAILSPAKNRLAFSFVLNRESLSSGAVPSRFTADGRK
jgi:lysylphosphatidylglycerol synthetase-like protein (DUF2156 family)